VGVEPITVDIERMVRHFRNGVENLGSVWAQVISAGDLRALEAAAAGEIGAFRLDDALWVRILYDIAVAHHQRRLDREQLIRATLPLYMGRVASFVREIADLDAAGVEERLECLCREFESSKRYLIERWRGARGARRGGPAA
jgi:hypothetical protein